MVDGVDAESRAARLFDAVAAEYDASGVDFFQPIARGLVSALDPRPGERWLDMGCGRGAVLLPLAEAVRPGLVVGVDVSPKMVELAASAASERGLTNVQVVVGNAQAPDPTLDTFDGVASSLVLFFLPDPLSALRGWLDLIRPNGRIGVTTFGDTDPRWRRVDDVLLPYMPGRDARTSGTEGPFSSVAGIEALLENAGFESAHSVTETLDVTFRDSDQWHAFSMSTGQRAGWLTVPEADREAIRAETVKRLRESARPDGSIVFTQEVRHTIAHRPKA